MTADLIETRDITALLLRRSLERDDLPMPFRGRQVELLVTYIAGMEYHNSDVEARALPPVGELALRREPGNEHDERAIALHWRGRRIGYVPRRHNTVLAALLDAGKPLAAELLATRPKCPAWMDKEEGMDRGIRISLIDL